MPSQTRADIDDMLKEVQQEPADQPEVDYGRASKPHSRFRKFLNACRLHKKKTIAVLAVTLLCLLAVVPISRYAIAGLVVSHDVTLEVFDSQTNEPVSGAEVLLRGKSAKTDGAGLAHLDNVKPGNTKATVSKKYYTTQAAPVTVGIRWSPNPHRVGLAATGRQVPVRITDKISGRGVVAAVITAGGTEAQTDADGEASIVVDVGVTTLEAQLDASGYNPARVSIAVGGDDITANTFAITPAGNVYFLSKKSGTIDIAKTNLDGTNRQTVLAGTGNEEVRNTVLLASRDWKFLALLARRDGTHASLYLLDTTTDKLTQIDTNNAVFSLAGWSGHNFVYSTRSNSVLDWQSGQNQIKTFNADTGQLTKVDESTAAGTNYTDYTAESFSPLYLLDDSIVYAKNWLGDSTQTAGKRPALYVARANGNDKHLVKDFDQSYLSLTQAEPHELYVQQNQGMTNTYYLYKTGNLSPDPTLNQQQFNQFYPTYLLSPSSNKTFWYEPRDGKNSLFTGDQNAQNSQDVLSAGEYVPYGWYSDAYLLVSKNASELYIAPTGQRLTETDMQKVTDYHKPSANFAGYGGGYGGL